jgi:hypothetical protein
MKTRGPKKIAALPGETAARALDRIVLVDRIRAQVKAGTYRWPSSRKIAAALVDIIFPA